MLYAMRGQHAYGAVGPGLGVLLGHQRLALGPALYAFEQGSAQVPVRLAGRQCRIEVDMGFDQRRNHEPAARIKRLGRWRGTRQRVRLRLDRREDAIGPLQIEQAGAAAQPGIDDLLHGGS